MSTEFVCLRRFARRLLPVLLFNIFAVATTARSQDLVVYTWNVLNDQQNSDATIRGQMQFIANLNPRPHVVALQEANGAAHFDRNVYIDALNDFTGVPWQGRFHDDLLIATSLPIVEHETRLFPYCDNFEPARPGLRVAVNFGGRTVQVFAVHLQVWDFDEKRNPDCPNADFPNRNTERQLSVRDLLAWTAESRFAGQVKLVGGDFNATPDHAEISSSTTGMYSAFRDAWPGVGTGPDKTLRLTQPGCNESSLTWRVDYWFSNLGGAATPVSTTLPRGSDGCFNGFWSDHIGVRVRYSLPTSSLRIPGTLEAELFDEGGEGVAYHDNSPGNTGGQFRQTDVDIEVTSDTGGGYNVGWISPQEWLRYTVNVSTGTNYTLDARVASPGSGGRFHVEVDGVNATGPQAIPNTGSWQGWTNVTQRGIHLASGLHTIRFFADAATSGAIGNLNFLKFTTGGTTGAFNPISLPGTVQAEEFDAGGEGVGYHDDEPANQGGKYRTADGVDVESTTDSASRGGFIVGWWGDGEWLKYTVRVESAGLYTVEARVASVGAGGTFHIEVNGVDQTGPIAVPNTGGWQTWQTVTTTISLPAGQHVLRVHGDTVGPVTNAVGNLNYLRFTPAQ